jgi:heme A synthase
MKILRNCTMYLLVGWWILGIGVCCQDSRINTHMAIVEITGVSIVLLLLWLGLLFLEYSKNDEHTAMVSDYRFMGAIILFAMVGQENPNDARHI